MGKLQKAFLAGMFAGAITTGLLAAWIVHLGSSLETSADVVDAYATEWSELELSSECDHHFRIVSEMLRHPEK